ncbi:glycosyltransferase family 1 protein [soil metagenome]
MRIGIMLRSLDEKGGIGVYTRGILEELLAQGQEHEFVLFYRTAGNLGRHASLPNVTERLLEAPHQTLWDQVMIPPACRRESVDVLFHPKFTVPLAAPCPSVMVVHGADWFIPEQARFYGRFDVFQIRRLMPLYFRKAARVISVSELTTENFNRVLGLPEGKVRTIYFAPARHFMRVENASILAEVRSRYELPERFILTLTKLGGDGRKNFGGVVAGYRHLHEHHPHAEGSSPPALVVGGKNVDQLREPFGIPGEGWGRDVHFPGWIDQEDLPAVYSLADAYLYPSNLEAFPIPLTEAMACGTPIVTSDRNGLEEIAGDAALLVDPDDAVAVGEALASILRDPALARRLRVAGLERSNRFSWDRCGRETLEVLVEAAGGDAT